MIPAEFDYHVAGSAAEAVELLRDNPGARLLAGGHSLLPMMKLRLAAPPALIDIRGIDELREIGGDGDDLVVGALATHAAVAASPQVRERQPALADAAAAIGDVQVRNRGTLGGSLAHADPSADYTAVVLVAGARIQVTGGDGDREIAAQDLFEGLYQTSVADDEIITAVRFPDAEGAVGAYVKFAQPASGFAIVGAAARLQLDGETCSSARVAVTGVADRPVRLRSLESALSGASLDEESLREACAGAGADLEDVRDDQYADADYRRHLVGVMARRAITRALG